MLVLSRKESEVIQIGEDISVIVVRIGWNSVRIGIEAPTGVRVIRRELVYQPQQKGGDCESESK